MLINTNKVTTDDSSFLSMFSWPEPFGFVSYKMTIVPSTVFSTSLQVVPITIKVFYRARLKTSKPWFLVSSDVFKRHCEVISCSVFVSPFFVLHNGSQVNQVVFDSFLHSLTPCWCIQTQISFVIQQPFSLVSHPYSSILRDGDITPVHWIVHSNMIKKAKLHF